ncbi:MAG: hypothetical protein IH984_10310 [Planctomycetes bacterium]|nr:hypothetical protein [Planctomycetota bacterium]
MKSNNKGKDIIDMVPAFHEAGHAVIAVIVSKHFEYVTVKDAIDEDGKAAPGCIKWKIEGEVIEYAIPPPGWQVNLDDVMASLGGLVAQQIYTETKDILEGWGDRQKALDQIRLQAGLRHLKDDDPLVDGIYQAAFKKCEECLKSRWNQVENVAKSLYKEGRLNERQVRTLITQAMDKAG